jgi:phosphatidylglycerol---prolipoprotein diacylglyceryl transferase
MHWNASPEIFHTSFLTLRWYGLLFSFSFYLGYRWTLYVFAREKRPTALVDQILVYMLFGTILGARLGHCLFYEPEVYLPDPIRILKVWEGGLASHGAFVGIFISLLIFSRRVKNMSVLWLHDRLCVPVALAGFFIRMGNLFNSEILGKPSNVPWAFIFDRVDPNTPRHPVQLYEALTYLVIFFVLVPVYQRTQAKEREGRIFGLFLMLVFGARFFLEFFKAEQIALEASLPLNMGQILSIPLVAFGAFLYMKAKPASPATRPSPATRRTS